MALYVIATQHCLDGASLSQFIQTLVLTNIDRLPEIIKTYESICPRLMQVSKITTTSLANVIDVECRLDYCVQVSTTCFFSTNYKLNPLGICFYINFIVAFKYLAI